jgi:hypothetical protein
MAGLLTVVAVERRLLTIDEVTFRLTLQSSSPTRVQQASQYTGCSLC